MLETCCDILKEAYKRNWITSRDGNISVRHHDRGYFYITPSGVRKQNMQPEMFKKMNIHKKLISSSYDYSWSEVKQTNLSDTFKPSGEMPLHFGLQKELGQHRDSARVVVHVHPTYCVAAMHAGINLNTLLNQFPELSRHTKVAPSVGDVAPVSQELADVCHSNLELDKDGNINYDIIGIKGHGVVAIGDDPWTAYEHIERLEHICKIILASK